jgi:hypothetical protein
MVDEQHGGGDSSPQGGEIMWAPSLQDFLLIIRTAAAVISALAIVYAALQFRFQVWIKAQEKWTDPEFTKLRTRVFARLPGQDWEPWENSVGMAACRRFDEFVRLAPYLGLLPWMRCMGERRMLANWGKPIAKGWKILKPLVEAERKKWNSEWDEKWEAFEEMGEKASRSKPPSRTWLATIFRVTVNACGAEKVTSRVMTEAFPDEVKLAVNRMPNQQTAADPQSSK